MSENRPALEPLSTKKLERAAQFPTLPNQLRQQAGIETKDPKTKRPLAKTYAEIKNKKKIADFQVPTKEQEELLRELGVQITDQEAKRFPQIEASREDFLTTTGLAGILAKVRQATAKFVNQEGEEDLVSFLKRDFVLIQEIFLSLSKIKKLRAVLSTTNDEEAKQLKKSLTTVEQFLSQKVIPALSLSKEEKENYHNKAEAELNQKKTRKKKQENYFQKASRVLTKEKARRLLHLLLKKQSLKEMPLRLEEEVFTIAGAIKHLELLALLKKEGNKGPGINFPRTKEIIAEQLVILEENKEKRTEAINKIIDAIAPITNFIRQHFHHDTAYLLSQMLARKQATCTGKTLMIGIILKYLGLDARYNGVLIRANSFFGGQHADCQVFLPNGTILGLDANSSLDYSQRSSRFNLGKFHHKAYILVPQPEEIVTDPKEFQKQLKDGKVFLTAPKGWIPYQHIGESHRLNAPSRRWPSLPYGNLAVFYTRIINLAKNGERETYLREADKLYQQAIEINPQDANAIHNRGGFYQKHYQELAELYGKEPIELLRTTDKLYQQAIEINPQDADAIYNRGVLYQIHYQELAELYGKEPIELLRTTDKLYQQAIEINPQDADAIYNRGVLLKSFSRIS